MFLCFAAFIELHHACPAEEDTDWRIHWPVAAPVSTQSVRCPGEGDTPGLGLAHRSCLTGGVWGPVDASDCGSAAVREISRKVRWVHHTIHCLCTRFAEL